MPLLEVTNIFLLFSTDWPWDDFRIILRECREKAPQRLDGKLSKIGKTSREWNRARHPKVWTHLATNYGRGNRRIFIIQYLIHLYLFRMKKIKFWQPMCGSIWLVFFTLSSLSFSSWTSVGPNSKFGPNTKYIRFLKMHRIPNIEYIQFLKNDGIQIPNSAIRTLLFELFK